jgi:hypothetical protein
MLAFWEGAANNVPGAPFRGIPAGGCALRVMLGRAMLGRAMVCTEALAIGGGATITGRIPPGGVGGAASSVIIGAAPPNVMLGVDRGGGAPDVGRCGAALGPTFGR